MPVMHVLLNHHVFGDKIQWESWLERNLDLGRISPELRLSGLEMFPREGNFRPTLMMVCTTLDNKCLGGTYHIIPYHTSTPTWWRYVRHLTTSARVVHTMLVTRPEGRYNALHMPPGAQAKIRKMLIDVDVKMGPMPNAQMCNLWDPIRRPSGPRAMLSL